MAVGAIDEDGDLIVVRELHDEGNCRCGGGTMQARTGALAAFATVFGGVAVSARILGLSRLGAAGLDMFAARRAAMDDVCRRDNLIHRRRGLMRHGMGELPQDELAHQQENHGPAMAMKSGHSRSVAATARPCNLNESDHQARSNPRRRINR